MQRIELNLTTGEFKVIELTPAEIIDAQARTDAEALEKAARPAPEDVVDHITKLSPARKVQLKNELGKL